MAEITYTKSTEQNMQVFTWSSVTESDTFQAIPSAWLQPMPSEISMDAGGTFGGATLVAKVDGGASGGVDASDLTATAISISAAANVSIGNIAISRLTPTATGGAGQSINVIIRLAR